MQINSIFIAYGINFSIRARKWAFVENARQTYSKSRRANDIFTNLVIKIMLEVTQRLAGFFF